MNTKGIFYGWWIVIGAFLALVAHSGTYNSFGVFFRPIQLELDWTRADVSWAIFLRMFFQGVSYILVGALIDRYGPRKVIPFFTILLFAGYILFSQISALWQLYLFCGVMVGIGYGIGYAPLSSILTRWFDKRRGLALGIAASGMGVGTTFIPPLTSHLILHAGWRFALLITGLFLLVVFVAVSFVLRRDPSEKGIAPYGYRKVHISKQVVIEGMNSSNRWSGATLHKALRSNQLWILILILSAFTLNLQMVMFHIVNYATDMNISLTSAASILSFVGIGSLVGRLAGGVLSDIVAIKRLLIFYLAGIAVLLSCLILIRSMALFTVFGLFFGLLSGGVIPLEVASVNRLFGSKSIGAILGVVFFGMMIGGGIGPLLAGYVFDVTQSYYYAFVFGSVLTCAAALLSLLLKVPEGRGDL